MYVPYEQCTYDIMLYVGACMYIATHILYSYIVTHSLLSIVKIYHMQRIITSVTNIDSYTLYLTYTYNISVNNIHTMFKYLHTKSLTCIDITII